MSRQFISIVAWGFLVGGANAQLTPTQHATLVDEMRQLSARRIAYNQGWQPPGAAKAWAMDCSNTSRYIYQTVFGLQLPRTASDQYYALKQVKRIVYAPRLANGRVDTEALLSQLRSGDLLFWQWTYDIERDPPITHVMVYLGRTADGTPKMAGSASRSKGEQTNRGGVNVYVFDPNASMGGVKNIFGDYIRRGEFVGFGRVIKQEPISGAQTADGTGGYRQTVPAVMRVN
ncbi:MAG: C40 family peptidase [Verrucomicrobiales bacterium]|nr:C40 family peptidase [Verrucomicrobiales bacterium]